MASSESEFSSSVSSVSSQNTDEFESIAKQSSESKEDSDFSGEEDVFLPYDEDLEPLATEEDIAIYEQEVARENELEEKLLKKFSKETDIQTWCECQHCNLALIANHVECLCCAEIERCRDLVGTEEEPNKCITLHPGFRNVCLDQWVLRTASTGLKTRKNKSYRAMFEQGLKSEEEFLRSVAYRQFVRLVYDCVGYSMRLPLPSCVYNSIRSEFMSEDGTFKGFEDLEDE